MTDTCEWTTIAGGRTTLTLTATEIALMDVALQAQKVSLVQKVKQQFISVTGETLNKWKRKRVTDWKGTDVLAKQSTERRNANILLICRECTAENNL